MLSRIDSKKVTDLIKIDISIIDKIERILENNELIEIAIWYEDTVLHVICILNPAFLQII